MENNNVTNMFGLFSECSSLSSLPDISKWKINNGIKMSYMFFGCSSLSSLPDISKWNTNYDKCHMLDECLNMIYGIIISKRIIANFKL